MEAMLFLMIPLIIMFMISGALNLYLITKVTDLKAINSNEKNDTDSLQYKHYMKLGQITLEKKQLLMKNADIRRRP